MYFNPVRVMDLAGRLDAILNQKPMRAEHARQEILSEEERVPLTAIIEVFEHLGRGYTFENISKQGESIFFNTAMDIDTTHQMPKVVLGEALIATLESSEQLVASQYTNSDCPGIRLLVANATVNPKVLKHLSHDICCLVRAAVALNKKTPQAVLDALTRDPFIHVRELSINALGEDPYEGGDDSYLVSLTADQCNCYQVCDNLNEFDDFFINAGLEIPMIAIPFRDAIQNYGKWWWGTQPQPIPQFDYMMESVDYLRNPVPAQYVINHWGHGVNSYGLNMRIVGGEIAIMAQVLWGGAYGDNKKDTQLWDDLCQIVDNFLLLDDSNFHSAAVQRKYLIQYSDFRIGNHPILEVFENGTWHIQEGPWSESSEQIDISDMLVIPHKSDPDPWGELLKFMRKELGYIAALNPDNPELTSDLVAYADISEGVYQVVLLIYFSDEGNFYRSKGKWKKLSDEHSINLDDLITYNVLPTFTAIFDQSEEDGIPLPVKEMFEHEVPGSVEGEAPPRSSKVETESSKAVLGIATGIYGVGEGTLQFVVVYDGTSPKFMFPSRFPDDVIEDTLTAIGWRIANYVGDPNDLDDFVDSFGYNTSNNISIFDPYDNIDLAFVSARDIINVDNGLDDDAEVVVYDPIMPKQVEESGE